MNKMNRITDFELKFFNLLKNELKTQYNIDVAIDLQEENGITDIFGDNITNAILQVLYQQTQPAKKILYNILKEFIPKELRFEQIVTFEEFSSLIDHILQILVQN